MHDQYSSALSGTQFSASNDRIAAADQFIGEVLGHLRRAEGLTQKELSHAAASTEEEIRAIENGDAAISLTLLFKIGLVLGIDISDIIQSAGSYVQIIKGQMEKEDPVVSKIKIAGTT